MNPIYVDEPDPAADLWDEERAAWALYRGSRSASQEDRERWWAAIQRIEDVRAAAGWPRLRSAEVTQP